MTASLYVHVPFCVRKCEYCDFYSEAAGEADIDRYLEALEREFRLRFPQGLSPETISLAAARPRDFQPPSCESWAKPLRGTLIDACLTSLRSRSTPER